MAITSPGLGSGLDVTSIISQLMLIEQQPLNALKKEETSLNAKISSFGKIQSNLATLRDKAATFNASSLWGRTTTTLADTSVASVTSIAGKNGEAGIHSLQINALATAQTVSSNTFVDANAVLSEGTLTIELGTWAGGSPATGFTAKSGSSAISIPIGAGDNSLSKIRDKINAAGAGVTASIINDASGARLSMRSSSTGQENAFRVAVTESADDGIAAAGLSALAYDARGTSVMTRNQIAGNAQALIDGVAVTSASNTLDTVIEGLSIKLQKVTAGSVEMSVVADSADIKTSINDFVTAFNGLSDTIKSETKYDAATKTAGKLQSDRTALSIQSKMRTLLSEAFTGGGSGALTALSDIGLSINASGKLELKSSKLDDALSKPEQVKALLSGGDGLTTSTSGFMTRFRQFADATQGTDGPVDSRTTGLKSQLSRVSDRQSAMETRLTSTEARLKKQYELLDTRMSKINSLSSSINLMIAGLYR